MSWLAKDLREMRFTMGNSQAISYPFMDQMSPIDKELAAAEEASWGGNQGKARVCARRAVALAGEAWQARQAPLSKRGDAMAHLRRIQQEASFPLPVRQAADRLTTPVPRRDSSPFTTDPIGDARIIIAHLTAHADDSA